MHSSFYLIEHKSDFDQNISKAPSHCTCLPHQHYPPSAPHPNPPSLSLFDCHEVVPAAPIIRRVLVDRGGTTAGNLRTIAEVKRSRVPVERRCIPERFGLRGALQALLSYVPSMRPLESPNCMPAQSSRRNMRDAFRFLLGGHLIIARTIAGERRPWYRSSKVLRQPCSPLRNSWCVIATDLQLVFLMNQDTLCVPGLQNFQPGQNWSFPEFQIGLGSNM